MFCRIAACSLFIATAAGLSADTTLPGNLPPLLELRDILRKNVKDLPEAELDNVASQALLDRVQGRILAPGESFNEESDQAAIQVKRIFEPGCLYVRIGQVSLGLAPQLAAILRDTNLLAGTRGLVLDLRFAGGTDYVGAANAANLLVAGDTPLLDWGEGIVRGTSKERGWDLPITVLVNHETRGAAEALAATLRSAHVGLVIGNRTAGKAAVYREIPLADGRRLRLATARVRAGENSILGPEGVQPDISVKVTPEHERAYLSDPFTGITPGTGLPSGTNQVVGTVNVRRRLTEAELVRQRRGNQEGIAGSDLPPPIASGPKTPVVRDPVLGRALDLIKGLAVLQPAHSSSSATTGGK
jgi:hypothetical protein